MVATDRADRMWAHPVYHMAVEKHQSAVRLTRRAGVDAITRAVERYCKDQGGSDKCPRCSAVMEPTVVGFRCPNCHINWMDGA